MQTLNFTNYFTQNFLDPLQNVVVFKDIVSQDHCKQIADYSYELFTAGKMSKNAAGENRWRHRLINVDCEPINRIVSTFNEIFAKNNGTPDDKIGNIITYNVADSFIQPHTDDYGPYHLRVNLIMEKAEFRGNPIIQGLLYKMLPGDGWAFSPSHTVHGTTMLTTGRRINLSMGWNFNNLQDYTNAFISISSK
jgi:hypothetical protein